MTQRTSWLVLAAALRLLTACSQPESEPGDGQDHDGGADEDAGSNATGGDGGGNDTGSNGSTNNGSSLDASANQNDDCGDRFLNQDEGCDDGNKNASDGCSDTCKVEDGFACPIVGARCRPVACGDLKIVGDEECEDGAAEPGDGCDERCRIEDGYACGAPGEACHLTVCGDRTSEGREQCDDGNEVPYDGCHQCVKEPVCDSLGCAAVCGDGIKFPSEKCDDGNLRGGDGCSETCTLEDGFTCSETTQAPPDFVDLPILLRDFRGKDLAAVPAAGLAAGHPDFENKGGPFETGIVEAQLASDKKPVLAVGSGATTTSTAEMFDKWYRDDPEYNRTIIDTVRLERNDDGAYVFVDPAFFPLDDRGFEAEGHELERNDGHNFHFTSEVRTWFSYQGGEQLDFLGDDDVWVFVNGHLAVDLGGVHGQLPGSVTLDASGTDARFGIQAGNIYEIVVFQAERHTSESKYRLTLRDFVKARTSCESICGDGLLTPDEACDDMVNAGGYGECAEGCVFGPRCGDGVVQVEQGEQCDDQNRDEHDGCSNACEGIMVM